MPCLDFVFVEQAEVLLLLLVEVQSRDGFSIVVVEKDSEIALRVTCNDAVWLYLAAPNCLDDVECLGSSGVVTIPPS